jgi:5-methylcytosine-specific restriction protein A
VPRFDQNPGRRELRIALRDLAEEGDIRTDGHGRWSAIAWEVPPQSPSGGNTAPSSEDFRKTLVALKEKARREGLDRLELTAGDLHRIVDGYPGNDHRMPVCCAVMRQEMRGRDEVVDAPPKGAGASLTIAYSLR